MKKKYRLLKEVDFKDLLKRGRRFSSQNFVCYCLENNFLTGPLIGIIIPKKKCKLSHDRKYLKRVFWALNTREVIFSFPKIKCVVFYRDFFYERFKSGNFKFDLLKIDYLNLIKKVCSRQK